MRRWGILIVTFCFILAGCVTTNAVRLGMVANRPSVPWRDVVVYRTADQVPGRYEEVALLVSTGSSRWTNETQMWNSMMQSAGVLGANAIILDAMSEPSSGAKVAAAIFGVGGADRKGKAIAIYVYPKED